MSVRIKIGQAYYDTENNAASSVCIIENYAINELMPFIVLRPKSTSIANKSAVACEAGCASDHISYSHKDRNTLNEIAKATNYDLAKIETDCSTDCSAFMAVCAIAGGAKIDYGITAPTTTNMRLKFKQSGDYDILIDDQHTTITDYLKRGDILVQEGKHTVMVLENGSMHDDGITEEPEISITPIVSLNIKTINVELEEIKDTAVKINLKITNQKTGFEPKVVNNTTIKKYKWTYALRKLSDNTVITNQVKLSSGKLAIDIDNLTPNSDYMLQIIAKKDDRIAFSSASILFTTTEVNQQIEIEPDLEESLKTS
jgi:hypothetical protein